MTSAADRIAQVLGPTAARREYLTATAGTAQAAVVPGPSGAVNGFTATLVAGAAPIKYELTATSATSLTTASSVYLNAYDRVDWEVDRDTRRVVVAPVTAAAAFRAWVWQSSP